jgi:hypothetical protein
MSTVVEPSVSERRRAPRIPLAMSASLTRGRASAAGFVRDASELGLLIRLTEPLLELGGNATVEIAFPSRGPRGFRVAELRRDVDPAGDVLVALRLLDPPGVDAPVARTTEDPPGWLRDRAAARVRPRAVVRADICALGGAAWELVMSSPAAGVPDPLARWLTSLAAEIGAPASEPPRTARGLLDAISLMSASP